MYNPRSPEANKMALSAYGGMGNSLNERRRILQAEFENFEGNKNRATMEELYDFLDRKSGKNFDRNLGRQLYEIIKKSDGKIEIEDFISVLIETEDTINFRIQLERAKITELLNKKEEIIKNKEAEINATKNDVFANSHVLIQVLEATNLEPMEVEGKIDPYVTIKCGPQLFETATISNNRNPIWNEAFKFPINEGVSDIRFIVNDKERNKCGENIGTLKIPLEELEDQNTQDRNEYIIRQDGLRTRSKIHVLIKYVYSKTKIYDDELRRIDEEIYSIEGNVKYNEIALNNLREPFGGNNVKENAKLAFMKADDTNFQSKPREHLKADQPPQATARSVDLGHLKIRDLEERFALLFEGYLKTKNIDSPFKIFLVMTSIIFVLNLFMCFLRPAFIDVEPTELISFFYFLFLNKFSILLALLALSLNQNNSVSQLYYRVGLVALMISLFLDFIWLVLFTSRWKIYFDEPVFKAKTMVIVFSFLHFFFKMAYCVQMWFCSIKYADFIRDLRKASGLHPAVTSNSSGIGNL